jgi:hypothetical protein
MFLAKINLKGYGDRAEIRILTNIISAFTNRNSVRAETLSVGCDDMGYHIESEFYITDQVFKCILFLLQQADKEAIDG